MIYTCKKSVSIGEQDTSPIKTEVFTKGREYTCIDGFITDNIGVLRSINKPQFHDHFVAKFEVEQSVLKNQEMDMVPKSTVIQILQDYFFNVDGMQYKDCEAIKKLIKNCNMKEQELSDKLKNILEDNCTSLPAWTFKREQAVLRAMKAAYELGLPKWVSVENGLPQVGEKCLICFESSNILMGKLMNENKWFGFYLDSFSAVSNDNPVTHWMSLPNPTQS